MKNRILIIIMLICLNHSDGVGEPKVEVLRTPADGIQPQTLVDSHGTLHLVYFKGSPKGGNLFYVKREHGKTAWSDSIQVNSQDNSVKRNGVIGSAQIAMGKNGRIHVVWFRMRPPEYWYSRMNDDGSGFEIQRNLVTQYNKGVESGASVAADEEGNVHILWHAGKFSEQDKRAVYITQSSDEGMTFTLERRTIPDETGVCACCGLKAFLNRKGTLYLSFRAAGNKIHRDMMLMESTNGGKEFSLQRIHEWLVNACPVSTTSLTESPEGKIAMAWETKGQVYFSYVDNPTETVSPPGIAELRRKSPEIAINEKGETLLAWGDGLGWKSGGSLNWQIFDNLGKATQQKSEGEARIRNFSFPSVTAKPDGNFVVIY